MGRIAAVLAALIGGGSLLGFGHAAFAGKTPPRLTVAHEKVKRKAVLGSYCELPSRAPDGTPEAQLCSDAPASTGPSTRRGGAFPARGGWTLTLDAIVASRSMSVELRRADGRHWGKSKRLRARRLGASKRRWTVELPRPVRGGDELSIFVLYAGGGDASFAMPLRLRPWRG